jgi:hypothetical protein
MTAKLALKHNWIAKGAPTTQLNLKTDRTEKFNSSRKLQSAAKLK